MLTIGLDIGTTSLSGVVRDASKGRILCTFTERNEASLKRRKGFEWLQDPEKIRDQVSGIYRKLLRRYPEAAAAGVTGQMHGILYTNARGKAVTPLYTWQDTQGNTGFRRGASYVEFLREKTGCRLASGFGVVTHFIKLQQKSIPRDARQFCTIGDFIAMRFAENTTPVTDVTHAASIGMFDTRALRFDSIAMECAGFDPGFFPEVRPSFDPIGKTAEGLLVFPAVGDNQASFLGAVPDRDGCLLVNIGTGSQVCLFSRTFSEAEGIDIRPFPLGGYLYVGASLYGGKSYAMLEMFFRQVFTNFGVQPPKELFQTMNRLAAEAKGDLLRVNSRFSGTRDDDALRGAITNIGIGNFTPGNLCAGFLRGILEELHSVYKCFPGRLRASVSRCIGSGNGMRKNAFMRQCCAEVFGMPLQVSRHEEEAACGAAMIAAIGAGAK